MSRWKLSLLLIALAVIGSFTTARPVYAGTVVSNLLDDGSVGSLRQVIGAVMSGDTITFTPGLSGTITLDGSQLSINKNITIAGPGAGQITVSGNNNSRVFHIPAGQRVTISGLTITNGSSSDGGGIGNHGTLTLSQTLIVSNTTINQSDGGGIWNVGTLTLFETGILSNTADARGGGIFNAGTLNMQFQQIRLNNAIKGGGIYNDSVGIITVDQVEILDNRAIDQGGGVYNEKIITVTDSLLTDNQSGLDGGGVFNYSDATINVSDSHVAGNTAAKGGGGLFNDSGGNAEVVRSSIEGNSAAAGGGLFNSGDLKVRRSLIAGNRQNDPATFGGGGIGTSGGRLDLFNTTISGNIADHDGGAIDNYNGSQLTLANTTIISNTSNAALSAGGIHSGLNSTVTLRNSVLAANRNPQGGATDCVGSGFVSQGYNLVGASDSCSFSATSGDLAGTESMPLDPQLGPLTDNGGPTGSHAPLAGSPLLDGGNPVPPGSGGAACENIDQRGLSRPQGPRCDIGAVELAQTPLPAERLAFVIQPGEAPAGRLLDPQPTVRAVDANGQTVSSYNGTISLAILDGGAADAQLGGTTSRPAVNGVAGFDDLSINLAGAGYRLQASAAGLLNATSEPFTVTAPVSETTWLVMLYLAGDDQAGIGEDMALLLNRLRYNPAARIVALYDGPGTTDSRIYTWEAGGRIDLTEQAAVAPEWTGGIAGTPGARELDTGSPLTVQNFVTWARASYPGPAYSFLAMVDHGGGWAPDFGSGPQPAGGRRVLAGGWRGMSLDYHSPGGPGLSSLSTRDTATALAGLGPIDLLFFDACLMGMLESAYEVAPYAERYLAGQNLLFADFPYDDYLAPDGLTNTTSPDQLARRIVERYNRGSGLFNPFALAALDLRPLRGADNLAARLDTLAARLLAALPPSPVPLGNPLRIALSEAYSATQKFDYDNSLQIDPQDGYVDLIDFAERLSLDLRMPVEVRSAALAVVEAGEAMVLARRSESGRYAGIFWDLSGARGIAIFLPLAEQDWRPSGLDPGETAAAEDQLNYYADSNQLALTRDAPNWAALLRRLQAGTPIRNPLAPALTQTGDRLRQPFAAPAPAPRREGVAAPLIVR